MKSTPGWSGLLLPMIFCLLGCDPGAGGASEGGKVMTIGVMPKLMGIDYFNVCESGAREAAKELGIELIYDGPTTNDVARQAEVLDTWIIRKLNVIAVAPNDPTALAPTLKKARERGIKVLTWDSDSSEDSRDLFVNQAAAADIGSGLVDIMAEEIGKDGEVAIITGSLTAANQNIWMDFMKKRMAEKHPGMKLVATKPSGEDQQMAYQVAKDLIKAYPALKGIFGITSVAFPGAAQGVRDSGNTGKIAVTGLSTPKSMRPFVKDGTVKTFLLWSPADLGYLTVHLGKQLYEKGKLPEKISPGRLKDITVRGTEALLGPPLRFDKANIDGFDF